MSRAKMDSLYTYPIAGHRPDLIPYTGGKSELVGNIVPLIDHAIEEFNVTDYYELCGGGARMLLNLPFSGLTKRVYNDIDTGMAALFYCCSQRDLVPKLMALLEQKGVGAEVFNEVKQQREQSILGVDCYDLVTAAACTFLLLRQSQKARQESFNNKLMELNNMRLYMDHIYRLPEFLETLEGIDVTKRSVFDILMEDRDWSKSFIYLDPPYHPDSTMAQNKNYKFNWTKEDHDKLVKLLLDRPLGKVALSGLDNPSYKLLVEAGWTRIYLKNLRVKSSTSKQKEEDEESKEQRHQKEEVWINFDIPNSLEEEISEWEPDPQ